VTADRTDRHFPFPHLDGRLGFASAPIENGFNRLQESIAQVARGVTATGRVILGIDKRFHDRPPDVRVAPLPTTTPHLKTTTPEMLLLGFGSEPVLITISPTTFSRRVVDRYEHIGRAARKIKVCGLWKLRPFRPRGPFTLTGTNSPSVRAASGDLEAPSRIQGRPI
jgi:hypothetical protein